MNASWTSPDGAAVLHLGDSLTILPTLPESSVDSVVTDPPYEFGFMDRAWDKTGIAYNVDLWRAVLRVLKPGGHLLAFGGSRTYHRMACAIEDAGFDIRDQIMWLHGSGFPKSLDVSKAIDKAAGAERDTIGQKPSPDGRLRADESHRGHSSGYSGGLNVNRFVTAPVTPDAARWSGWGTALKPANEPICLARKPLSALTVAANVLAHGTGAINVDGCRVGIADWDHKGIGGGGTHKIGECLENGVYSGGWKRAPENHAAGRWPANVCHDGSPEVVALFPQAHSRGNVAHETKPAGRRGVSTNLLDGCSSAFTTSYPHCSDGGGSAARFFYCAKASKEDRDEGCNGFAARSRPTMGSGIGGQPDQQRANNRNIHPTVKTTDLMRWLVRLVTPPGGTVLDPFTGSGSTGKACALEGFNFVGIELDPEYHAIAIARIFAAHTSATGPLFAGVAS